MIHESTPPKKNGMNMGIDPGGGRIPSINSSASFESWWIDDWPLMTKDLASLEKSFSFQHPPRPPFLGACFLGGNLYIPSQ